MSGEGSREVVPCCIPEVVYREYMSLLVYPRVYLPGYTLVPACPVLYVRGATGHVSSGVTGRGALFFENSLGMSQMAGLSPQFCYISDSPIELRFRDHLMNF